MANKKKSVNPVNAAKGRVAVAKSAVSNVAARKKIAKKEFDKASEVSSTTPYDSVQNAAIERGRRALIIESRATKVMPKLMSKYSDAVRTSGRTKVTKQAQTRMQNLKKSNEAKEVARKKNPRSK
jgi:hypothetical protein